MNILFCSVGRRAELLKNFRKSLSEGSRIIATDMSEYAPAIYFADKYYIVPSIYSDGYLDILLEICEKERIDAITTLIDPEISLLAKWRKNFERMGVEVLAPYEETAKLCFDKYQLFLHLKKNGVPTVQTYDSFVEAESAISRGEVHLPVFVKPRTGSGSVGARKIDSIEQLELVCQQDPTLIIQEYMVGRDLDADIYIDTITHEPVSIFTKKKLETKIGGASKTISFHDEKLVEFICNALKCFSFNGPIDMDLFYQDGQYYLSEINPRFGGAYLHAYGAGVDFVKLIESNFNRKENYPCFGNYEDDIVMMMYDSVVIEKVKHE